ncbi:hypothetical protein TSOC_003656 [Tetrabaena socialis]|uniref:Uncharacterized protein n=1 Tax=Tetrabaena socialis TaxID=47790 RepID=A0A2J8AB07_9CHLO|nr:hypothetical protein TSOC_003656 [Tetrabaena socialis]|eukprot:PNH09653.1 hypothetical protein TSOC_003656 [Tetrabaena socialis]
MILVRSLRGPLSVGVLLRLFGELSVRRSGHVAVTLTAPRCPCPPAAAPLRGLASADAAAALSGGRSLGSGGGAEGRRGDGGPAGGAASSAGSARGQPPADELAAEAERVMRDPNTIAPQAARSVQDLAPDPLRLAPELQPGGAATRLESDVAGAVDVRAAETGGAGEKGEGRADVRGEAGEAVVEGEDSLPASDPHTRLAPWGE